MLFLNFCPIQNVSPDLLNARDLVLAVPGTYRAGIWVIDNLFLSSGVVTLCIVWSLALGAREITIAGFAPQLGVISSKQRPRKCTIYGNDGEDYAFLLKGHEDLRQDERVMQVYRCRLPAKAFPLYSHCVILFSHLIWMWCGQLFGLVNTLLANDAHTAEKDLSIQRYAVIPLSPNSGLIGWVPNCDTLHSLIREYRDARKVKSCYTSCLNSCSILLSEL
jgi:FKBP12-rapamycin complex-associated protein